MVFFIILQGGTASSETGPTAASEGVKYVYFEATLGVEKDSLISDTFVPSKYNGIACSDYKNFLKRGKLLTNKLLTQKISQLILG